VEEKKESKEQSAFVALVTITWSRVMGDGCAKCRECNTAANPYSKVQRLKYRE
jgi:hypothetical protein